MVKIVDNSIVFEEIPDKVTLALSISNCQNRCKGCHSSFLRDDVGDEVNTENFDKYFGNIIPKCNCVLFLGEGNDKNGLLALNEHVKNVYNVETALYSGRDSVEDEFYDVFDYVKIGSYQEKYGPLNKETTNQRLFYHKNDITYKFWDKYKK